MRCFFALTAGAAALATAFAPAFAQQAPADAPDDEADEELSELERLSRSADDPFDNVSGESEREPVTVTLRALDKITARYADIEIGMNEIARFGSLEIQPRYCDKKPPEEVPETTAFLEVFDTEYGARESDLKNPEKILLEDRIAAEEIDTLTVEPVGELSAAGSGETAPAAMRDARGLQPAPEVLEGPEAEGVNIFRGWMFASSPALNALEHPVYDVWVIDCKTKPVEN